MVNERKCRCVLREGDLYDISTAGGKGAKDRLLAKINRTDLDVVNEIQCGNDASITHLVLRRK